MSFIYTRELFSSRINAKIQNRAGLITSIEDLMDETVRHVLADVDLRSTRRKQPLSPNLVHGRMEYAAPSDFSAGGIIDVPQQAKREDGSFFYVPTEEFYTRWEPGAIALDNYNGVNTILINSRVDDIAITPSYLDGVSAGGGTWTVVGDANTLVVDNDDFFQGSGSLSFGIAAGGTTAGIQNTGLNSFDLTSYLSGDGAAYVWAKITTTSGITNFTLRLGSSSSNYYQKTTTTRNDGTAFQVGWNLLRFDLTGYSTVGSPVITATNFISLFMTKDAGKAADTSYKFNYLSLKRAKNADFKYYSNFGWVDSTGAYKENSTADTDCLVASNDEFQIFLAKAKHLAFGEVDDPQNAIDAAQKDYMDIVKKYQMLNPSEAKIQSSQYYDYGNTRYNGTEPRNYWRS